MDSRDPTASSQPEDVAAAFAACRDEILDCWRARVALEVEGASKLGKPILLDSFPILYDNIADALSAGHARELATAGTNLASMHGRERANLTQYKPEDLIQELQILREVVFTVLRQRQLHLSKKDADVIGRSIELVVRESVSGYSAANRELSEAFIASLSHDLRNPLNIASASAQLIELTTSDPRAGALAKRVVGKLRDADAMIQTLLDAALLKGRMKLKLELAAFEIMTLVEEVCADIPVTGQPVRVQGEPVTGYWCRASMKRVLENLTSNAQKYGDTSKPITVAVHRNAGRMMLSVHNEGTPIPQDEMANLFKPYKRIEKLDVKGWGLGLPFVQNVVESHGGSVVVDSAESRGTTFTVSIPVDARPFVQ